MMKVKQMARSLAHNGFSGEGVLDNDDGDGARENDLSPIF